TEVLEEAQEISPLIPRKEIGRRRDFRDLPIVTIDGETARDFDDAVLVRRLENGNYELQVHIADVANYVEEGSAIHEEARKRGSIDFDLPEPVIEFDEHGFMKSVEASERNWAHRLIEEFMLAANETVAAHLEKRGLASLYRIHEKPDPKRIYEFETIAASFGY